MRLDVYLTAAELTPGALTDHVVGVIDVLRASTTIAAALDHGARAVIPFEGTDEVVAASHNLERTSVLLAGERKMLPVPGFDLGNSPLEVTAEVVAGKTVLLSTTNGTHALLQCHGAREVVIASYVNCSAVTALFRTALRSGLSVALVCAGQDRHFALEDAVCAGRLARAAARRFTSVTLNDAAHACSLLDRRYGDNLETLFLDAAHGRSLADAGFGADLERCAMVDAHPVVPVYVDRHIVKLGDGR